MSESHANTSRSITEETVEMSTDEKYLFDLVGFVIVRDVLSEEHLEVANAAIDASELTQSAEYFGDSVALRRRRSLQRLPGIRRAENHRLGGAREAVQR